MAPDTPDRRLARALGLAIDEPQVRQLLGALPPQERTMLELHYGFRDGKERTLEDIGRELGLGDDHIREIQKRALGKLRTRAGAAVATSRSAGTGPVVGL